MATAHAKFAGVLGVCLATSGPGAIHLLNGLYDAKLDHQPVLATVGQSVRAALGGDFQQEVDPHSLFKDVAGNYVQTCTTPMQMRHLIDRAVRIALAERCVTCLIVPNDVQELEAEQPPHEHGTIHSGVGYSAPRVMPAEADLRRAADVLNAVLGRAAVPDDLPFVTGQIGLLGTRPSWEMMQGCDTLLMIGSSFPYAEFLPKEGGARGVQIDIDPRMLSIRYPMEVNLVGDAAATLQALLPLLETKKTGRGASPWKARSPSGGRRKRNAPISRATSLILSSCSGRPPPGCPTAPSSLPIQAPRRAGLRALSSFVAA